MDDDFSTDPRLGDAAILAKNMWNNGVDRDVIADRLARRKYDKKTIECALSALPSGEPDNIVVGKPRSNPFRFLLITCGLIVGILGVLMLVANRAAHGQTPLLVFGLLGLAFGGLLIKLGQW